MPANMLPTPHHQITPNQTPNIDRDHRHRPHNPPPQVRPSHHSLYQRFSQPPEHIYEPPVNFRENSPRLYGPCGTIRYAAPDGKPYSA